MLLLQRCSFARSAGDTQFVTDLRARKDAAEEEVKKLNAEVEQLKEQVKNAERGERVAKVEVQRLEEKLQSAASRRSERREQIVES